jgi:acyl carrier protein
MVSLLRLLEKKYSIDIPDQCATPEDFDTVERIVGLVRRFQESEVVKG